MLAAGGGYITRARWFEEEVVNPAFALLSLSARPCLLMQEVLYIQMGRQNKPEETDEIKYRCGIMGIVLIEGT